MTNPSQYVYYRDLSPLRVKKNNKIGLAANYLQSFGSAYECVNEGFERMLLLPLSLPLKNGEMQ